MTPLHYAVKAPTLTGLSILLKHEALAIGMNNWNQGPLNTALYTQNDQAYISPLLDAGADINERDCGGCSVLAPATFMNNVRTAHYLLSRGADINCQDGDGATALKYSIWNKSHDRPSLLLELGADLSLANYQGETA
ncbi:hypothetical protein N7G274_000401 [Stereocaulon virgatum]|uniref:Ankyrin n=1 Tax=Stereocaulon virgatum TaxID=373712 RepID=A0ABR4ASI3_9LECA